MLFTTASKVHSCQLPKYTFASCQSTHSSTAAVQQEFHVQKVKADIYKVQGHQRCKDTCNVSIKVYEAIKSFRWVMSLLGGDDVTWSIMASCNLAIGYLRTTPLPLITPPSSCLLHPPLYLTASTDSWFISDHFFQLHVIRGD